MEAENQLRIRDGEQWFASVSYDQVEGRQPQWNSIFVVDSLDRIRDTVVSLGGTVLIHAMPVPGSAMTVCTEPVLGTTLPVMAAGEGDA